MTSSKPAVVISAVRAPFRSSNAFVATVVPWTMSEGADPASASIRAMPERMACAGLCGVDGALKESSREPRAATKSVKVPPVSIPILIFSTAEVWMRRLISVAI